MALLRIGGQLRGCAAARLRGARGSRQHAAAQEQLRED